MGLHRVVPSAPALHGNGGHGFAEDRPGAAAGLGLARGRYSLGAMVGRCSAMERLFLQMRYLAGHVRLALLEGERGTGKRLAARTLHDLSPRRAGPFVARLASEALAGDLPMLLHEAQGGTLYLAGIDALSLDEQARLVHFLGWLRHGAARGLAAGARPSAPAADAPQAGLPGEAPHAVLLSTTRALRPLVLYGKFRADLQRELGSVHLAVPSLRERREDIPVLLEHFLKRYAPANGGRRLRGYAPDLLPALLAQSWPGNVAELESALAAAAVRSTGEWLRAYDLSGAAADRSIAGKPASGPASAPSVSVQGTAAVWTARSGEPPRLYQPGGRTPGAAAPYPRAPQRSAPSGGGPQDPESFDPNLDRAILRHIRRVLAVVNGNKLRAARLLGISRSTLYRLLESEAARQTEASPDTAM